MLWSIICTKDGCANKDIEYLMPNQTEPVMCGGCKDFILPIITDIPEPEPAPYPPYIPEEL